MIKAVIFDLDGVLVDANNIHYKALNKALENIDVKFSINEKEHALYYDGLPTREKLKRISEEKGLNFKFHDQIYLSKQKYTEEFLDKYIKCNENILKIFRNLKKNSLDIAIATNSISKTLSFCIDRLKIKEYISFSISNEQVNKPKPSPEIYLRCFIELGLSPKEVLIVEDSSHGKISALKSGGNLLPLDHLEDLTFEYVIDAINKINDSTSNYNLTDDRWHSNKLNILIPMAGKGSRFQDRGYVFPKPLIEVNQKPMIQLVIENLNIKAQYIFLVLNEHYDKYNLKYFLESICPGCKIVIVDRITEGAACTSLLAKEFINNDNMLLIANSDQYIEWNSSEIMYSLLSSNADGGILCFDSSHPKWSFAKVENDIVTEVAEKKSISNNATVGIYYWKKGSDYVKYCESMINKNLRVNNEFYICPVYNEAIKDQKRIEIRKVKKMYGLGTPEDLDFFLENYKK